MTVDVPVTAIGQLSGAWRQCVGTGRMALALRSDYRDSLALAQREIGFEHIRGHGLLSRAMGIVSESQGSRRYGFTYLDQVIDTYLSLGVRPFLELGFMPHALASGDQTFSWWRANVTPPRDYREWSALIRAVVAHLVDRYGVAEVAKWPIEVWNEPNLSGFWKDADRQAYFHLYEVSARTVKDIDATLQVGGPAVAPRAEGWYEEFVEFVTGADVPCDFFSAHAYSAGLPQPIPFGVYQTLRPPADLLEQFGRPAAALAGGPLEGIPVHITEFNTSYDPTNPIHDTAYQAAYLAPVVAGGGALASSFSYWTFCDVFEEKGVPASFFHGGFGLLGYRQLRKPAFHLYTFMARMGPAILAQGVDHLVTRHGDGRVTILAWQPVGGSDDGPYGSAPDTHRVRFSIPVPAPEVAYLRRCVNEEDGNAWTAWRELGRPMSPSPHVMDLLHEASQPRVRHGSLPVRDGRVDVDLSLSRHEVTLVEITPVSPCVHEELDDARLLG